MNERSGTTGRPEADLVLVTGMSGAGRSTALHALEDMGFDAVDNLPLGLLPRLANAVRSERDSNPVAIGIDVRTRDFGVEFLQSELSQLADVGGVRVRLVFLDCDDEVLIRRFAETRRRHPLAADRPVADGLRLERRIIRAIRDISDVVIDTTELTIWDLKQRISGVFSANSRRGMSLTVMSFGFRNGIPREADIAFDVRFLKNPHYDPELRLLTGLDDAVGTAIAMDPDCDGFIEDAMRLLHRTLPRYEEEGKSYLTVAIGCTGGRHRSVYVAERLGDALESADRQVHRFHRDLPGDGTEVRNDKNP